MKKKHKKTHHHNFNQPYHNHNHRGPLQPSPRGGIWGFFNDEEERTKKVLDKLLFGEYNSLAEMATVVNGGHKSELIERLLYKQIRKLLHEDLKSLISNN